MFPPHQISRCLLRCYGGLQKSRSIVSGIQHSRYFASKQEANFGICLDIDGVLARGQVPLPHAKDVLQRIQDKVPVAIVTNHLHRDAYKAYQLKELLGIQFLSEQMVQCQGALAMYKHLFDKHCLLVGQGPLAGLTEDLGFKAIHWMEDIAVAYPQLDVVDHQKRYEVSKSDMKEFDYTRIEAVIILGEPKKWEMCLQLLVDMLLTEGKPSYKAQRKNHQTLPVVVCNVDLQFMHRAAFPRYGNGAFVVCLEALFKKITGQDLQYEAVLGKPSEATFRYAEHVLARDAQRLGIKSPLKTMYMIGDNKSVDILGANLYQNYINHLQDPGKYGELNIPACRLPPKNAELFPQTVETVRSILVNTGVTVEGEESSYADHRHREFVNQEDFSKPTAKVNDILQALEYIMMEEDFTF